MNAAHLNHLVPDDTFDHLKLLIKQLPEYSKNRNLYKRPRIPSVIVPVEKIAEYGNPLRLPNILLYAGYSVNRSFLRLSNGMYVYYSFIGLNKSEANSLATDPSPGGRLLREDDSISAFLLLQSLTIRSFQRLGQGALSVGYRGLHWSRGSGG